MSQTTVVLSFCLAISCLPTSAVADPSAAPTESGAVEPATSLEMEAGPGDRLEVGNFAGSVRITGWDQDRVSIEARHSPSSPVLLEREGSTLRAMPRAWSAAARSFSVESPERGEARLRGQPPAAVVFEIMAPAWMPVSVAGPMNDVTVADMQGGVEISIFSGSIQVTGGGSPVTIRALAGTILLADGNGRLTISGTRDAVTVRNCRGDLRVETTDGDVILEDLQTESTEVTSVTGDIKMSGGPVRGGRHDLSTHAGDIVLRLGQDAGARIAATAFRGSLETDLPGAAPPREGHVELATGDGAAQIRLQSFTGTIKILR